MDDTGLGRCILFGDFALYPEVRQLYRRGIRLTTCHPQHAAFLTVLAETPGIMVSKTELKAKLWPGETPPKNRLNVLASTLWTLLGDNKPRKRKYFVAAGREGYCFVCPVERVECAEDSRSNLADEAYLAGRHCLDNRQESSLREAVSWFKRAIDHAPSHALAWVGLADAYIMMGIHCVEAPGEAFAKARAAAQEAMRIEASISEALVSLAWVKLCQDREWGAAEVGFARALQKKPGYPFAHNGLALLQLVTGHAEDNIASLEKAHKLSPLSPPLNALLCHSLYIARRYEDAVEAGRKAVISDPQSCIAHASLAHALLRAGCHDKAIDHFKEARLLSHDSRVYLGFWGYACAFLGEREKAQRALRKLLSFPSHEYVPSYFIGLIYLGLHHDDECIKWLGRACDERSHWVLFLNSDPIFDRVRSYPSFQQLLVRAGFESISALTGHQGEIEDEAHNQPDNPSSPAIAS